MTDINKTQHRLNSETIKQHLSKQLSQTRYDHVLRVTDLAEKLAKAHQHDIFETQCAALLHDISKETSLESFIKLKISLPETLAYIYQHFPKVGHAFSGPLLAKHYFGQLPLSIQEAMTWHTTGKANMSCLDQIIYIADFCEPGRSRDTRDLLNLAYKSLDLATAQIAYLSMKHLIEHKRPLHPFSLQCYNHYQQYLT